MDALSPSTHTESRSGDSCGTKPSLPEADRRVTVQNVRTGDSTSTIQAGTIFGGVHYSVKHRRFPEAVLVAMLALAVAIAPDGVTKATVVSTLPSAVFTFPERPVIVAAVRPMADTCISDWFMPARTMVSSSTAEEKPPYGTHWNELEQFKDGAPPDKGIFVITLHGAEKGRGVTITGMRVDVVDRRPPPQGYLWKNNCPTHPMSFGYVKVDLDHRIPTLETEPLDESVRLATELQGWNVDPLRFPYDVSADRGESIAVSATAESCDCSWVIKLDWSSAGKTGTLIVDNGDDPFRVVSSSNTVQCSFGVSVSTTDWAPYCNG